MQWTSIALINTSHPYIEPLCPPGTRNYGPVNVILYCHHNYQAWIKLKSAWQWPYICLRKCLPSEARRHQAAEVWGCSPQQGPGAEPLVGVRGRSPPENFEKMKAGGHQRTAQMNRFWTKAGQNQSGKSAIWMLNPSRFWVYLLEQYQLQHPWP